jgi:hypothetical protein
VLALQELLGISYKDAAHRLYMAELEKIKANEKMYKAFSSLNESTQRSLEILSKSVNEVMGTKSSTT